MKILVTGGLGFIGSTLVNRLAINNDDIDIIDDYSNGYESNLSTRKISNIFNCDISKLERYQEYTSTANYDVIYHLACHPRSFSVENPRRDYEVNALAMLNMIDLAKRCKSKLIFSSNSGIYDASSLPISESTRDNPTTPYDAHKALAEYYLKLYGKLYGLNYTIFRFGTVYGPKQRVNDVLGWRPLIATFCRDLAAGNPFTVDGDGKQTRDLIYVGDIVEALIKARTVIGKYGPYILGTGKEVSVNEVVKLLDPKAVTVKRSRKIGDINRMRLSSKLAWKDLAWAPTVSLKSGLAHTVEWVTNNISEETAASLTA